MATSVVKPEKAGKTTHVDQNAKEM